MVKPIVSTTAAIAEAVTEIVKLLSRWLGSSDIRRMAKCIRNADKIVEILEELDLDNKKLDKLIKKHDKYNN